MLLNKRLNSVSSSLIRELKEKANQFDDIIDFTLGEPHLSHLTYSVIKEQLDQQITINSIGYPNFYGLTSLKEAICEYCAINYHQHYESTSEIIVTSGCSEGLRAVLETVLNEGDEVIIFEPAFSLYQSMTTLCGGAVVAYNLHETNLSITEEKLLSCVGPKTKVILLNSPHNPTGHVFNESDLAIIKKVALQNQLFIIVDEIYRELIYDDKPFISLGTDNELRSRLFVINGFSKSHAMTGWRIGYILGPKQYMKQVGIVHQNLVACTCVISQYAALEAIKHNEITQTLKQYYDENRQQLVTKLTPYFEEIITPLGGFYLYAKIPTRCLNSYDYANNLLIEAKVAVVPSVAFQAKDTRYIRISYCCDKDNLLNGISRIQAYNHTKLI